jgi:dihydroorotate dehydrogenase (NAD+) catalytic subunit
VIKLSNGHCFEFCTAAGALAFDGRGWIWEWPLRWLGLVDPQFFTIIVKTLLPEEWPGNLRWSHPWSVVKFISKEGEKINPIKALMNPSLIGGVINAVGLTGPGIDNWIERIYPVIHRHRYKVIVSITGIAGGRGCLEIARKLNGLKNVVGIEFNASCPNTDSILLENPEMTVDMCYALKEVSEHPLFLKLSYAQPYCEIAKEAEEIVEGISINTVPWRIVFGDKISPLARYGSGGVSGLVARPFTWRMVRELSEATSIPIIGPTIWQYEDIMTLRKMGARAYHFGTIFLPFPWKPNSFVKKYRKENRT